MRTRETQTIIAVRTATAILLCALAWGCVVESASAGDEDFLLGLAAGTTNATTVTETNNGDGAGATSTTVADSITDNGDGTITAVLDGTTKMYAKCIQDNTASGNLYGGGGMTDPCTTGPVGTLQYCSINNNSCNGGTDSGLLDGGGTSEAFTSCDDLTLGGHTDWRVPTAAELASFYRNVVLAQPTIFPGVLTLPTHWSSNSISSLNGALFDFSTNSFSSGSKSAVHRVRCMRIP